MIDARHAELPRQRSKPSPDTGRGLAAAALFVGYAALWSTSAALLHGRSDLDLFFWPAAQAVTSGHLLSIYATNNLGAGPDANGPLGLLPLIPLSAVARAGGWAGDIEVRAIVANAVLSICSLAMALAAVRMIREGRGSIEWRVAAVAVFLLAPTLWISVADYGHFEQPIEIMFVLLAAGLTLRRRPVAAGFLLGLALLARTTAVLYLLPIALLPSGEGALPARAKIAATALGTFALGLAPFLLADFGIALHSLLGYRGSEPIGGGSAWVLALRTPWQDAVQRADIYVAVVAAVSLTAVSWRRRRRSRASWPDVCGVLAIAGACFPMLVKTVYPYYFVEPYVFATIWWLARPGSALNWRAAVPVLVTVDAALLNWARPLPWTSAAVAVGVTSTGVLAVAIALIATDVWKRHRTPSADRAIGSSTPDCREATLRPAAVS